VPHQDFGRASMRLLLNRTLERRKGGRADRRHDQRTIQLQRQYSFQSA
jgi:hypothetical protein